MTTSVSNKVTRSPTRVVAFQQDGDRDLTAITVMRRWSGARAIRDDTIR
jgi:hypothetical protein